MQKNGCQRNPHPEDLLAIGKVLKTWGVKGFVKVFSYAESPESFNRITELYVQESGKVRAIPIEDNKEQKKFLMLKF